MMRNLLTMKAGKILFTGTSSMVCFFFSDDPIKVKLAYFLLSLMFLDMLMGTASLFFLKQKWDYRIFASGIVKKSVMLVAVVFGHLLDSNSPFGQVDFSFQTIFNGAFIGTEIFSIVQNFEKCGVKIPFIDKYIKLD